MILVDTNVPLRIVQIGHGHRQVALDALGLLADREGEHFAIAPQSLYEMYVVCTRPATQNGLGMAALRAHQEISSTRAIFQLLPETSQVFDTWDGLIAKYQVMGKQAHDAHLVAIMVEHRVQRILTFNDADFRRYGEIQVLNPFDVVGQARV